ncbi:histidinol dehydrogenase [Hellea balneolensis]|uniref:histidinol dehydrogenase n=1 Tax=Hellea balneolensis TaxID=287478 RepID=UPI000418C583|nr:histidinol dehydrogenase [Hellea balneolensis]
MKTFIWTDLDEAARKVALSRPAGLSDPALIASVQDIMHRVKSEGDKAVIDFTRKFDGVSLEDLKVPQEALKTAWQNLAEDQKNAIKLARKNIKKFHQAQIPKDIEVETTKGVICRREARAIETAGLYVPGGTAPLISTLLMLAIPAKVAGVRYRIVVTPPGKDGQVNPAILAAAYYCKVTNVYVCGGAQAIAALAYGTETIPRCDKIFGPGNAYVATAKSLAAQEPGGPAIDMPAGPSEAMVVANDKANPAFVASDLLSQAEHDTLAQAICVATSQAAADKIRKKIDIQIATLPRRDIAEKAMAQSRMIIADNRGDVVDIINRYAPEHLILQINKPNTLVPAIRNAGSIFLGPWTPESVGDYASGTNHTLPTYGAARAYSGVTLESFIKYISVQKLTRKGLERIGPAVEKLAEMEGLEAHRRAVSLRLESKT